MLCDRGRRRTRGEKERKNLNLNLHFFLFYNGYKLGRMSLFFWPLILIRNYNLSTTEEYSSNNKLLN